MDKNKNAAPKGRAKGAKAAFIGETDAMHEAALAEIKARGEDPKKILSDMASMKARLRDQYLRPEAAISDDLIVMPDFAEDPDAWGLGEVIFFEESVAAGIPTPNAGSPGRPLELSDVMKGIDPSGKLLFKISCFPAALTELEHGDKVLVDPKAKPRDGDLVLAELAGRGQLVLRVRVTEASESILDADLPDIASFKASEISGLRIHGRILWSWHPIR